MSDIIKEIREAQRERERAKRTAAYTGCLLLLLQLFAAPFVIMLFLGALHHDVSDSVPALGWWLVFAGNLAVRIVWTLLTGPFKRK